MAEHEHRCEAMEKRYARIEWIGWGTWVLTIKDSASTRIRYCPFCGVELPKAALEQIAAIIEAEKGEGDA